MSKVIRSAKQLSYNNKICKSNNKVKTTWDIIKTETGKNRTKRGTLLINIDNKLIANEQSIANFFNTYFIK
jgi:hypothetical protein